MKKIVEYIIDAVVIVNLLLGVIKVAKAEEGTQPGTTATKTEEMAKPEKAGTYSTFNDCGLLKTAVDHSSQYGQEGSVGAGEANDGTEDVSLNVRKDVGKDVTGTLLVKTAVKEDKSTRSGRLGLALPLTDGIYVGGYLTTTDESAVGVVGVQRAQDSTVLLREGLTCINSPKSKKTQLAIEARKNMGTWEATVSARGEVEEMKTGNKRKTVNGWLGVQAKRKGDIFSVGAGGKRFIKAHYRHVFGNKTKFDASWEKSFNSISRKTEKWVRLGVARGF